MTRYEAACLLCKHKLPIGLLFPLNGKWLCKSCWNKEKEKILAKLILKELQRRGEWNPSER